MQQQLRRVVRAIARALVPASVRSSRRYLQLRDALLTQDEMYPDTHDEIYTEEYFAVGVERAAALSAGPMARSIVSLFAPKTVIDVGCGTGALLEAFRNHGCLVAGLEYADAGLKYCRARGLPVSKFDIEKNNASLELTKKYDVAVSFEVAEHLPASVADRFADLLGSLTAVIVMSAATPGQGGVDHVNEQPHSYWIDKFRRRGFVHQEAVSKDLSREWRAANVAWFYCDNVMVFQVNP